MDSGYWTVTVVVHGAIEDEEQINVTEEGDLREYLHQTWVAAQADGIRTEVYVLRHDHPVWEDGSCECIQFVTDMRPTHVFP